MHNSSGQDSIILHVSEPEIEPPMINARFPVPKINFDSQIHLKKRLIEDKPEVRAQTFALLTGSAAHGEQKE